MINFPQDFLWGAATSAHQVEGNNTNNDWWDWEQKGGSKEPSGSACRSYELYREDFDLAKQLHHNSHRFSVEWSRIEPVEGEFSQEAIAHYCEVAVALRQRGLEPLVTLHHFTNPIWFSRMGGWAHKDAARYFVRFVEKISAAMAPQVRFWVTINEPMVYTYYSYIIGDWPPQEHSLRKARQVTDNLTKGHIAAYRCIHDVYKKNKLFPPEVSIAKNVQAFVPCSRTLRNRLGVYLRNKYYNFEFVDRLMKARAMDFIGLNYYSRGLVDVEGWGMRALLLDSCRKNHSTLPKNSMGWDIYPQGLQEVVTAFHRRYNLKLFVMENGICTQDDTQRWEYIREHLKSLNAAMQEGARVLGYIYWSLIDNYEWDKGFTPRFGLIDVDYRTFKRTPRESAFKFAQVCRSGLLE